MIFCVHVRWSECLAIAGNLWQTLELTSDPGCNNYHYATVTAVKAPARRGGNAAHPQDSQEDVHDAHCNGVMVLTVMLFMLIMANLMTMI